MRTVLYAALAATILVTATQPALAQSGQDLFQQALVKERADGELRQAIALYERIAREFSADRTLTASALVRMGQCYEKLGSTEAERAYQRVVSEFADQSESAAQARARLGALHAAVAVGAGPVARKVIALADMPGDPFQVVHPSPDGQRLAYINLDDGGLYVLDIASGATEQVAVGVPEFWNFYPCWSPDGKRLAFTQSIRETGAGSLRIIDVASRKVTVVARGPSAGITDVEDWSPDGRFLLFSSKMATSWPPPDYPGGDSLRLISVEDGSVRLLADDVHQGAASLSPDGRFVTFAVGGEANAQVFVQSLAGGTRRQITHTPGGNSRPRWAPGGHAIAYQRTNGIWIVPVADGAASGEPHLAAPGGNMELRQWTKAGLFYTLLQSAGTRMTPYQIAMDPTTGLPAAGGVQELTGNHPDSVSGFAWSPDMHRIAFGHRQSPEVSVYSVNPMGVVTYDLGRRGRAPYLRWSRDGREVLYEPYGRWGDSTGSAMVALDVATGHVRDLFPGIPGAAGMSLSPDGGQVTYIRLGTEWFKCGTSDQRRIEAVVVANIGDPASARDVVMGGNTDTAPLSGSAPPRFSPRGDRLLFARQACPGDSGPQESASSVWVVGIDGRGARRLGTAARITAAEWDPTGRFIAYSGWVGGDDGRFAIRVVEVASGTQTEIPLSQDVARRLTWAHLKVTGWSSDGTLLGFVAGSPYNAPWELWVVQGLEEGT